MEACAWQGVGHGVGVSCHLLGGSYLRCWQPFGVCREGLSRKRTKIFYRSYKKFDETMFLHALSVAPFHVSEIFDDVDDAYWMCSTLLQEIVDEHAPIKQKTIKGNHLPYMNGELRRAINVKRMLKRKFTKCNSNMNWDKYRKQRNIVTKLLKKSLQQYMKKKMQRGC